MGQNDISNHSPLEETSEDRILRELRNIYNASFHIDQRLQDIANAVEASTANIEILEEGISNLIDIPTRAVAIWYDHKEAKLWINSRFYIEFERTEPDLVSLMFYKNSGQPRKKKLQYSDIAEKLSDENTMNTINVTAIRARVKRIQEKLDKRLSTKGILIVKSKEFYFSSSVTDS